MPRPTKCRRVCHYPHTLEFFPTMAGEEKLPVILTVDEYETIRLIDREGMSQEQCSHSMQIARTTVQKIYGSARKKLADVLVEGLPLRIEGGDVQLCDGAPSGCPQAGCFKRDYHQRYQKPKGDTVMRIAVTYDNGEIFQRFGHTKNFKVYDVEQGRVTNSTVVDTNGSGHGALAGVLTALHVDAVICGGIGGGAQNALAAANIRVYGGVSGQADQAVEALLDNKLEYNPNVQCSHHGEHHHDHEHTCGEHGCGEHHHCSHS
ncbi:DUF134 domain-containing protein [Pseudoflavonifractor sp. An85]|uniref:DUF134 domain-containing protein n=1 Tax=Pseudoflavonifractor sp. An85 TaxID=1965661 RepID=UPI000B392222|nr:DUF134 domain-containing protein [Pseudoflavonifractor sp. An85]OUN20501.1 DNA-binding protein [Pseudoflavonifractor sp. An85]